MKLVYTLSELRLVYRDSFVYSFRSQTKGGYTAIYHMYKLAYTDTSSSQMHLILNCM